MWMVTTEMKTPDGGVSLETAWFAYRDDAEGYMDAAQAAENAVMSVLWDECGQRQHSTNGPGMTNKRAEYVRLPY